VYVPGQSHSRLRDSGGAGGFDPYALYAKYACTLGAGQSGRTDWREACFVEYIAARLRLRRNDHDYEPRTDKGYGAMTRGDAQGMTERRHIPVILIVEDDKDLSEIMRVHLTHACYFVKQAFSFAEAIAILKQETFDLLLLDIMMPDGNGRDVCTYARQISACPVIFMSCLEDNDTIISSLNLGGDDYIVKPVNYEQLIARVGANLRRYRDLGTEARKTEKRRRFQDFTIDTASRKVYENDTKKGTGPLEIPLTQIEYDLLLVLTEHADELVLYDELYRSVWEIDSLGDWRTVLVHMSNLRKKIDPEKHGIISNVRGVGYLFSNL
jgi:DNA-binding response OmpR family regulator